MKPKPPKGLLENNTTYIYPPMNVYEDSLNFYYEIIAPGFDKKELSILITSDKYITILGSFRINIRNDVGLLENEYTLKSFSRNIYIFSNMDIEKISSKYNNGILEIVVGKIIKPPIRIEIPIK